MPLSKEENFRTSRTLINIVVDDCSVKLLDRCKKCVAVKRDYCEGK
jgi:hypothetical protein